MLAQGAHALLDVGAEEAQHLVGDAGVEGRHRLAQPVVERALRPARGVLGSGGDPLRHFQRGVEHLLARDTAAHETDPLGLAAVEEVGRQEVVLGLRHAAQERPHDRGVVARDDAQAQVPVGQAGLLGDDADVGH
jgi:hypothetical protein